MDSLDKIISDKVRETLGNQILTILRYEAQIAVLEAKIAELTPKDPPPAQP